MDILKFVTDRLAALGYAATEGDLVALKFNIRKAESILKAKTNLTTIPEGLFYVWCDMAAGLFMQNKKAAGELSTQYDFSAPIQSISEGDVSFKFAIAETGSFEDQFDAMLDKMVTPSEEIICAFRRLEW